MIHKYSLNGYNIVLDINSGSVHVVSDCVFDLLGSLDENDLQNGVPAEKTAALRAKYTDETVGGAIRELKDLYSAGLLFSADETAGFRGELSPVKAICLHVAHDCNLRCGYCFASSGDFGAGRAHAVSSQRGGNQDF